MVMFCNIYILFYPQAGETAHFLQVGLVFLVFGLFLFCFGFLFPLSGITKLSRIGVSCFLVLQQVTGTHHLLPDPFCQLELAAMGKNSAE